MFHKMILIMKKWWMTALIFTLALSLTSCSKKKKDVLQADYGFVECNGQNWSFDVYLIRSQSNVGTYEVSIVPVSIDQPGDIASVTIANSSTAGFRQKVNQVVLYKDDEITFTITEQELAQYDVLAITPFDATVDFANQNSAKFTSCAIPLVGDGVPTEGLTPTPQF